LTSSIQPSYVRRPAETPNPRKSKQVRTAKSWTLRSAQWFLRLRSPMAQDGTASDKGPSSTPSAPGCLSSQGPGAPVPTGFRPTIECIPASSTPLLHLARGGVVLSLELQAMHHRCSCCSHPHVPAAVATSLVYCPPLQTPPDCHRPHCQFP
jgi:hypothetical protein